MENNLIEGRIIIPIYSMANYRGFKVGLPTNLWIDEGKEYVRCGHSKRLKFQKDYAKKIHDWNFASMTLDGKIVEETYNGEESELTTKDLRKVSNFTKNNAYALSKVADFEITDNEFEFVMIKGGEPATDEQIRNQIEMVDKFISESEGDN